MLLLITFSLAVTQEMGARIGMVTGKGLGGLIREKFGLRLSFFAMSAMLIANLGTTIAEFAGIAAAMEIFHVSKFIAVPIAALFVFFLIKKADYRKVRSVFLFSAIIYIVYVISGILAHPNWSMAAKSTLVPSFELNKGYLITFIAVIGTTIAPWGQFFIQSYVVDKRLSIEHLNYERADVYFGAFVTDFIAFFIIVACAATLFASGTHISSAEQAAVALKPLAGNFASTLFAIGLLNASLLAAAILPLSSAYATSEAFGWEAGIDKTFPEAKNFYSLYTFFIIVGAAVVLIPKITLISVIFVSQTINGIILPVILIYVLKIVNDEEIMGKYTNGPVFNVIAWSTVVFIIAVTAILLVLTVFGFA
jgi:Mn2+/Fe2+ NRAMP family transporter